MTDGMLVRELMNDPDASAYSVIILVWTQSSLPYWCGALTLTVYSG
jgi:hypothetical protein